MRITAYLHVALLALAASGAPIGNDSNISNVGKDDTLTEQISPSHDSLATKPHNVLPILETDNHPRDDGPFEGDEQERTVLAARAPNKKKPTNPKPRKKPQSGPATTKATAKTKPKAPATPNRRPKAPANAQPTTPAKNLIPLINRFDAPLKLNTGAKSDSAHMLSGDAMKRANLPLTLKLTKGAMDITLDPKLLVSNTAGAKRVKTVVDAAECRKHDDGDGQGGESAVQTALRCIGHSVSTVLEAIFKPKVFPKWSVVGLGNSPKSDVIVSIGRATYTVIECKNMISLPPADVTWIMDHLSAFTTTKLPQQQGDPDEYVSLIDSSQPRQVQSRAARDPRIFPLEQVIAQMYYYKTTTAALTNYEDWIVFERPSLQSHVLKVTRVDNVKTVRGKNKSGILDIMLALALKGLKGKKKLSSILA